MYALIYFGGLSSMFSHRSNWSLLRSVAVAISLSCLVFVGTAEARVTQIVVDAKTSPAFNGQSFGAAGQSSPRVSFCKPITTLSLRRRGQATFARSVQLTRAAIRPRSSHL
jgi:hypothetical protein